jgi:hypothetical protein
MSEVVTPAPAAPATVNGNANPAPAENSAVPATPAAAEANAEANKEVANPETPAAAEGEKPKEEPALERVIPESYELAAPEGSLLDAARIEEIKAEAKEGKLTNEEAQKLVDRENSAIARHLQKDTEGFQARQREWADQIKADPVIGGENAPRVAEVTHRFVEKYAPEGLKKFIGSNNLGSYPDFVRMIHNAATDLGFSQTEMVVPGAHGGGEESPAQILYGKKQ